MPSTGDIIGLHDITVSGKFNCNKLHNKRVYGFRAAYVILVSTIEDSNRFRVMSLV